MVAPGVFGRIAEFGTGPVDADQRVERPGAGPQFRAGQEAGHQFLVGQLHVGVGGGDGEDACAGDVAPERQQDCLDRRRD